MKGIMWLIIGIMAAAVALPLAAALMGAVH